MKAYVLHFGAKKRLGIGGRNDGTGEWFVLSKDLKTTFVCCTGK